MSRRETDQRIQRHHLIGFAADIEKPHIPGLRTIFGLGLDVDLEQSAKAVEVIDIRAAEERAERRVHIGRRNAEFQHLVLIDVSKNLRRIGAEGRDHAADFRALAGAFDELLGLFPEIARRVAAPILQHQAETRSGAEPRDRRRSECKNDRLRHAEHELLIQFVDDRIDVQLGRAPVGPMLQRNEDEGVVRRKRPGQQAVPGQGRDRVDALHLLEDRLDFRTDPVGAFQRRRIRQLYVDQEVPLVFLRHEAPRHQAEQTGHQYRDSDQAGEAQCDLSRKIIRDAHVTLGYDVEHRVEPVVERLQPAFFLF